MVGWLGPPQLFDYKFYWIFTALAPRLIQLISCNVCQSVCLCHCVLVPSVRDRSQESWRGLVEECIPKITKLRTLLFKVLTIFEGFRFSLAFFCSVFVNQPTAHSQGVIRGRVCDCGCWRWWQVRCDKSHRAGDWYRCYYLQRAERFSVSRMHDCVIESKPQVQVLLNVKVEV